MKRHFAGGDLTDALKMAPHGEDKVFQVPQVAELVSGVGPVEKSAPEKVFYFMAYMNLIFVFLITFIIALALVVVGTSSGAGVPIRKLTNDILLSMP